MALVVETPRDAGRPSVQARTEQEAIDDAVDLGAQVIRLEAADPASGVIHAARDRGVTHVVLPYEDRGALERLRRPSLAELVLRELPDVEVHVVAARAPAD